jgi:hypothetical protein
VGSPEAVALTQLFQAPMRALGRAGVVSVWAAGNTGISVDGGAAVFPISVRAPLKITVGSTNRNDELQGTNLGAASVDVAAPGMKL